MSVNMDKFGLGDCIFEGKGANSTHRFKPISSGLNFNQKMVGTAECTKGMKSQNVQVKAFNDFWAESDGEYLTTRYHFNDDGLAWTQRFACRNNKTCLDNRYGNLVFKRGEISLEINSKTWGKCQILVR